MSPTHTHNHPEEEKINFHAISALFPVPGKDDFLELTKCLVNGEVPLVV